MSTRNPDPATHDRDTLGMTVERGDRQCAVVYVTGDVDAAAAPRFESQLRDQLNPAGSLLRLVVDLSAVSAMAHDGLTALLDVERCCFARSIRLCLVGCSPPVIELLESAELVGHFRHYAAVAEVIESASEA